MRKNLKPMMFLAFVTMIAMMVVAHTAAWADGAREPPDNDICADPPRPPTDSKVIYGTFTAKYKESDHSRYEIKTKLFLKPPRAGLITGDERSNIGVGCTKTDTIIDPRAGDTETGNKKTCPHWKSKETHWNYTETGPRFNHKFEKVIRIPKNLWDYTPRDLMSLYWARPCNQKKIIEREFGLTGHPVLTDIRIISNEHPGDDKAKAKMTGNFIIRFVE